MKRFLQWLIAPDVLPLVARLTLVVLTALVTEAELAASAGAGLEFAARQLANRP